MEAAQRRGMKRAKVALARKRATVSMSLKKLLGFFDADMLQLFDFERVLFDHMIPRDREALVRHRMGVDGTGFRFGTEAAAA
ncbi:MAG: hypothetical protein M3Z96_08260 [Pseudomonadota bacterium]|nr:hypothetical protein [Pseudomonadota bacterium]